MSAQRSAFRTAALFACALALAACGGILPKPEPQEILQPRAHVAADPGWPQVSWQLAVARPTANDQLDSPRLAVIPTPGRIEVYKGVTWPDRVPDVVQQATIGAFEDSGKILAVGRQSGGLRNDFILQMDLRDYQAVYRTPAGSPQIEVTVSARLVDFASSRVVAARVFHQTTDATATDVHAVAQAFDTALSGVLHDVVGWTLSSGQQVRAAEHPKGR
ncbi:MAG: membrane integrity-associated transporter subunit PqiC [Proteobacteria bacterium]|nr:membrane integrity-associated transporter subunit PqiC [Pseudomonadota bacterium]